MNRNADNVVRYELNLRNLPVLTPRQKRELATLSALPDEAINYDDIPSMHADDVSLYRPVKQQITARLDADVLVWLKAQGKGYQARMNAILRREMLASLKPRR
jgi:uncharacterized protein (DUF4415 family)